MRKRKTIASEEFKLSVFRDYYSSRMSKCAYARKYKLSHISQLYGWIKKHENVVKLLFLPSESSQEQDIMANRSKERYREENAQLKKHVKEL